MTRKPEEYIGAGIVLAVLIIANMAGCDVALAKENMLTHTADIPSELVLQTIAMEASNQNLDGQAWVARVIQTRAKRRGISEESVVLTPKQFSCWNDYKLANAWLVVNYSHKVRQMALNAYKMAITMTVKPTHYHTIKVKPYWSKGKKPLAVIGSHVFYDNIK